MKKNKKLYPRWPNENGRPFRNVKARYNTLNESKDDIIKEQQFLHYLGRNYHDEGNGYNSNYFDINTDLSNSNRLNIHNYKVNKERVLLNEIDGILPLEKEEIVKEIIGKIDSSPASRDCSYLESLNISNENEINNKVYINKNNSNNLRNKYFALATGYSPAYMRYLLESEKDKDNNYDDNKQGRYGQNNENLLVSSILKNNGNKITVNKSADHKRTKILYFSPVLKKNIKGIFTTVTKEEDQSLKKSRMIQSGLDFINSYKFKKPSLLLETLRGNNTTRNINKKSKNQHILIPKLIYDNNLGNTRKLKDKRDVEKKLFAKDDLTFNKLFLQLKKRSRRVKTENKEDDDGEKN